MIVFTNHQNIKFAGFGKNEKQALIDLAKAMKNYYKHNPVALSY